MPKIFFMANSRKPDYSRMFFKSLANILIYATAADTTSSLCLTVSRTIASFKFLHRVHPAPCITLSITFTLKFSCILHFLNTGCRADDVQLFLIRIPFHENSCKSIITQQSGLKLLREILSIDTNKIQSIPNVFEHF